MLTAVACTRKTDLTQYGTTDSTAVGMRHLEDKAQVNGWGRFVVTIFQRIRERDHLSPHDQMASRDQVWGLQWHLLGM